MKKQTRINPALALMLALMLALLTGLGAPVWAGTRTMTADVLIGDPIDGLEPSGTAPYLYDFGADSLEMGGNKLYYNTGTRNVVLTNLAAVTDSGAGVIDTSKDSGANWTYSGYVKIYAVSPLQLGGYLQTANHRGNGGGAGDIVVSAPGIIIGGTNSRGLSIEASGSVWAHAAPIALISTGSVSTAGGISSAQTTSNDRKPSSITISDGAGGPAGDISIGGSLEAYTPFRDAWEPNENIEVRGQSINVSGNVLTYRSGGMPPGAITLVGYGGAVTVGGYLQSYGSGNIWIHGGAVTISGTSVTIGGQDANTNSVDSSCPDGRSGGDISITATGGDIAVSGGLDAERGSASFNHGDLTLSATGTITLGGLDANVVREISLQAGAGTDILMTGALSNFTVDEGDKTFNFPTAGSVIGNDIVYDPEQAHDPALSGDYAILVNGVDTGKKLLESRPGGTLLLVK